ncbi:hypothetical protein GLAREA_09579 [Glarea lozoyensis ATCC 20868]|uniref:E3 ubiquitin-protein ligase CCNB1IP1 n=1 Tax=Glarea lozoyensis (strain ATCC 20868 / MF5171) TaxID=1116229 RepID=S3DPR5_GLAL2|nr:uncharacterized protein GLAREA_09579 [Glarea lozoyensis ATCC 20868]EPE28458.1 hypothetical protein GLAREA_09579 [Glarea lozoyensis ATCC 20868]
MRNPDDVVMTNLNPTEDYKSSVLCGLSPSIIMECSGRALNWWAYQATQEITYQEFLVKNLGQKCVSQNAQMDKVVNQANTEIANLRSQLSNLQIQNDSLKLKNEELNNSYKEKSRKHMQTQEMFDKMKRRSMLGQVQDAASDAVENTIQASAAANRYVDRVNSQARQRPVPPLFPNQQGSSVPNHGAGHTNMAPPTSNRETWGGFSSQGSNPHNPTLPQASTHRQPLQPMIHQATPRPFVANFQPSPVVQTPMLHKRQSPRTALASISGNGGSAFAGYGMSAGLKMSNQMGTQKNIGRPQVRSRVAHRSTPALNGSRDASYGPPPSSNNFTTNGPFY